MKKEILISLLFIAAILALVFLFGKSDGGQNNLDNQVLQEADKEDFEENTAKETGIPEKLNIDMPEKIETPYNPCYSLEVPEEIKEKRQEFSEQTQEAIRRNDEILNKHELPFEEFRGDENIKTVALTIDTGVGGGEGIGELLRLAEHYSIKLTFFVTGCWALENPELLQEIVKAGHSVGNHTLTHLNLAGESEAQIRREIGESDRILEDITGFRPALFRKPQYAGGNTITAYAAEYQKISVQGYPDLGDTGGWRSGTTAEDILSSVKAKTAPGAIWVFHNLSLSDLTAFEDIVRFHLEEGYKLVRVEDILK